MTEAQRIDRSRRAQLAFDEFFQPMLAELKAEYTDRLAEIARTELNRERRADGVAMLAVALRVVDTLQAGMNEIFRDGALAKESQARAERVGQMSDAKQRLLKIGTGY